LEPRRCLLLAVLCLSMARPACVASQKDEAPSPELANGGNSTKRRKNSFLPFLTAVANIVTTGDVAYDKELQHGVARHLQGHFDHAVQHYAEAASRSPGNRDSYIGAGYSFNVGHCGEAARCFATFLRLLREQGPQPRRHIRCKRAPTDSYQPPKVLPGDPSVSQPIRAWVDNGVFVSPSTFRDMADHIFDEFFCHFDPASVRHGEIVYVNTFLLCPYMETLHPRIRAPYILITHNSDFSAPVVSPIHDYTHVLKQKGLLAWFAQNPNVRHPKLHPLPQGLAVNTKTFSADWDTNLVNSVVRDFKTPELVEGRTHWLYVNFNARGMDVRRKVLNWAQMDAQRSWVTLRHKDDLSQEDYQREVRVHRFVFCPPGNGLDTHRLYESLQMGTIPIVVSTPNALDDMYATMPVMTIKTLNVLTLQYLEDEYPVLLAKMRKMWSSPEASVLTSTYWKNLIAARSREAVQSSLGPAAAP